MSMVKIDWDEWLWLIGRIAYLERLIDEHQTVTDGRVRVEDTILYGLCGKDRRETGLDG